MHWNEDDSSHIFVTGDVTCRSLVTGSFLKVAGAVTAADAIFSLAYDLEGFQAAKLRCRWLVAHGEGFACADIRADRFWVAAHLVQRYQAFSAEVLTRTAFVEPGRGGEDGVEVGPWIVSELARGVRVFTR